MNNHSTKVIEQIQCRGCIRIRTALAGLLVTFCTTPAVMAQEATHAYYTFETEAEENQVRVVTHHVASVSNHREETGSVRLRISNSAALLAARPNLASSAAAPHHEAIATGSQSEKANRARRRVGKVSANTVAHLEGRSRLHDAPERSRLRSSRWTQVVPVTLRFNRAEASMRKRTSSDHASPVRDSPEDLVPFRRQSTRTK